MSSRDPYAHIPNLSGLSAAGLESTRAGDPSRVFPASRGGVVDNVVGRILDVPRFKIYNTVGETGHGPGTAFVGFNGVEYDSDKMFLGSPYVTCRTPGLYLIIAHIQFSGSVADLWPKLCNPTNTRTYAGQTDKSDTTAFGKWFEVFGLWPANIGDQIGLLVYTSAATNIDGGQDQLWMEGVMVSTFGSDLQ